MSFEAKAITSRAESFRTPNSEGLYPVSNEPFSHLLLEHLANYAKPGVIIHVGSLMRGLDRLVNIPDMSGVIFADNDRATYLANRTILKLGCAFRNENGRAFESWEFCQLFSERNFRENFLRYLQNESEDDLAIIHQVFSRRVRKSTSTDRQVAHRLNLNKEITYQAPTLLFTRMLGESANPEINSWLATPQKINAALDAYEEGTIMLLNADITDPDTGNLIAEYCSILNAGISMVDVSNIYPYWLSPEQSRSLHSFFSTQTHMPVLPDTLLIHAIPLLEEEPYIREMQSLNDVSPFLATEMEQFASFLWTVGDYRRSSFQFHDYQPRWGNEPFTSLIDTGKVYSPQRNGLYISKSLIESI